jgi:DNA polymerase III gamma/tau subunit
MMLLAVDPVRAAQGELADDERERLTELGKQFSREDLMRAFDLLANAEQEIRNASQPRYHFEMVLLKWMHLRKLVPLTDLLASGGINSQNPTPKSQSAPRAVASSIAPQPPAKAGTSAPSHPSTAAPSPPRTAAPLKDAFLAEVRAGKGFFYNTVVAQAQRIDVTDEAITFTFSPTHRALKEQFNETRLWLESVAERAAGRRITVTAVGGEVGAQPSPQPSARQAETKAEPAAAGKRDLKAEAMSSSAVQAMLDVFPAEIRDVEEM